jgi:hypothetical protein
MTEPVEPKPEFRFMRFSVYSARSLYPGKRPPCGAARPQPFSSFLHQSKWVRGGEFRRCSAPGSQNFQKGATLCSEFGKHR